MLCGVAHRGVARTWAVLSESCKALRGQMREARLDVRQLDVQGTRVTDAWLRGVATTFTGLTKLDLERCTKITDAGLEHVGKLSNLTSLALTDCEGMTDAGLDHVGKLGNLTTLSLERCVRVTDAGCARLQDLLPGCKLDR